jgi:hypothetical protein
MISGQLLTSTFLFLFLFSYQAFSDQWIGSREVGYQSAYRYSDQNIIRSRPYFLLGQKYSTGFGEKDVASLEVNVAARGWIDSAEYRNPQDAIAVNGRTPGETTSEVTLRKASVALSAYSIRAEVGLQEIHWGETFGFGILDIVNPHDFRDPFFLDTSWTTVPVWLANLQYFLGGLTVQGIYNPFPQNNIYPAPFTVYSPSILAPGIQTAGPVTTGQQSLSSNAEFGGKLSYLFGNGLDLGVIGYQHGNRNLIYGIVSPNTVAPINATTQTYGVSLSQTLASWVIRGDSAIHTNQPNASSLLSSIATSENVTESQTILGTDYSDGLWLFGIQAQNDSYFASNGTRKLFWGSSKIQRSLFKKKLTLESFIFVGIQNSDQWYQPKITWNANSQVSLSLLSDFIFGGTQPSDGYFANISGQNRLFLQLVCHL